MRPDDSDLTTWSADALSVSIHQRLVSCREVMTAYLRRIDLRNPTYNAIILRRANDELLAEAKHCDDEIARGASRGWMHGMPQAIKDLSDVAGIASTKGSPLLSDVVPRADGLMVARMRSAGCIVVGKTNTPEFGLGSHTFNPVHGTTGNAYDPTKTAGGSSGGAAVALATAMLPVADGSDFMGSLRNPAAWNNVFGFRPSQGRVPTWPAADVYVSQLATEGPMGRTVLDVARLLEVQAGPDPRQPLALTDSFAVADVVGSFAALRDGQPLRIGWLGDLDGYLATEAGVLDVAAGAMRRFEYLGAVVESAALPMDPAVIWDAWLVWRRWLVGGGLRVFSTPGQRAQLKPEALWELECSEGLTASDVTTASAVRSTFFQRMRELFDRYDVLALPSAQVWPFDATTRWPKEISGRTMDTYHRWMEATIYATFAGLPCLSVPAGFSPDGLPIGTQLLGRPSGDAELLGVGALYETTIADLRVGEA